MVRVHVGEPFIVAISLREMSNQGARPAQTRKRSRKPLRFHRRPECDSLVLRHFSLRSSTAEHPPDKRKTVERHHAEGPFQSGATFQVATASWKLAPLSRWVAQTDERRAEAPQRLVRYQLQRPFSCMERRQFVGQPSDKPVRGPCHVPEV